MNYEKMISGCQKQNRDAQKVLFETYYPKFMGLCVRYSGNQNDAQDMLQNGFISIFKGFPKFKGENEGKLINWMRRIFINSYLMGVKKNNLEYATDFTDEDFKHPSVEMFEESQPSTIMTEQVGKLSAEEVHDALNTLTERERVVFNTVIIDGYSLKVVAKELEMKYNNANSALDKARKKLRRYFNRIEIHRRLAKHN